MASEAEHIAVANRNQGTIEFLVKDVPAHSPWIATVAFYKALHVVEAVFFNDRGVGHTSDHGQRFTVLKTTKKYQHIFKHYSQLARISNVARYLEDSVSGDKATIFEAYLPSDKILGIVLFHLLKQVEDSAIPELSHPGRLIRIERAKGVGTPAVATGSKKPAAPPANPK